MDLLKFADSLPVSKLILHLRSKIGRSISWGRNELCHAQ